jgi:hypothetical protein
VIPPALPEPDPPGVPNLPSAPMAPGPPIDDGLLVGPVLGGKAEPAAVDDLLVEDPIGSCGTYRVDDDLWPGDPEDHG